MIKSLIKNCLYTTSFFLVFITTLVSQNYNWAKKMGGTGSDQGRSVYTDQFGNVYLTGSFAGTVDFDPGPAVFNLIAGGLKDIFFAKYDAFGNLIWAKKMGGSSDDQGNDIVVNDSGYVYITGYFQTLCDFDPGPSTANLSGMGFKDAFIAKYDNNGNYKFAVRMASNGGEGDEGIGLEVDKLGNAYVSGYYSGTVDFDPSAANYYLPTYGSQDIFFAKYSKFGNFKWAKHIGTGGSEFALKMASDDSSNIYIAGEFSGVIDFNPSAAINTVSANGSYDIFFSKYDSLGNYMWAKCVGSYANDDDLGDISLDKNKNIYLTGAYISLGDFDPDMSTYTLTSNGAPDREVFFGKYTNNGNLIWVKRIGGGQVDYGSTIVADTNLNVFLAGYYQAQPIDIDPGPGITSLPWVSVWDMYLAKYDSNGDFISGGRMAGNNDDRPTRLHCGAGNNIYLTGHFSTTCDLNPLAPIQNFVSSGLTDVFLAKYSPPCSGPPTFSSSITGNTTVCSGSLNTYSVLIDLSLNSYSWILPTGWTGSSTTNIITVVAGSSGNISVAATNNCGTSTISILNVTVNNSPTITVNSGSICSGQTFTINPNGANTYTITGNNAIVSPSVTTTYSITGTNNFGCLSSNTAVSNVTVYITPTISVASGTICSGDSFTLSPSGANIYTITGGNTVVSPTTNTTYTVTGASTEGCINSNIAVANITVYPSPIISIIGGTICTGSSFTFNPTGANTYTFSGGSPIVNPSITTTYSVTGTSLQGCLNTIPTTATVTVANSILVSISGTNSVCVGQSLTLTGMGASSYSWSTGANTNSISPTPTTNVNYTLTGTSGPCNDSTVISITVFPLPIILASTNNSILCLGQSSTLTAGGGASYSWSPGGSGINLSITPSVTTTFTLTGIDLNGCQNTAIITQTVDNCTGTEFYLNFNSEALIYPNPNDGEINIYINSTSNNHTFEIYNSVGQLVLKEKIFNQRTIITLEKLTPGIYSGKLLNSNGILKNEKIIIR